jgi:predicted ATP-grasp superfamily ATP-dependent carboligase/protein-tyrosine-phosphatase
VSAAKTIVERSRVIKETFSSPVGGADFLASLSKRIEQLNIDTLIPGNDLALRAIASSYDAIRQLCNPGCPPPEVLAWVLDKAKTLEVAAECGVDAPRTVRVNDLAELRAMGSDISFPIIAKPRFAGLLSEFKARRFDSIAELEESVLLSQIHAGELIFQEFCDGEGVGVEVLMQNGKPTVMFQHRRLKEWPADGGVGVLVESQEVNPFLARQATSLLETIQWEGVAMVEFRFNPKNQSAKLMEVNGRFWGSLPLAVMSGLDFPYYYWQFAHGQKIDPPNGYKIGVRMRWSFGSISRLREILFTTRNQKHVGAEVASFLSDWSLSTRSAMWTEKDPMPALLDVFHAVAAFMAAAARASLRAILPEKTRNKLVEARSLQGAPRWAYIRLWLARSLRLFKIRPIRPILSGSAVVVFVCRGNRIRSAFAAAYLRALVRDRNPGLRIISAGTHAIAGAEVDTRACIAATDWGVSLHRHYARPVTAELIDNADLIFVFDHLNEAEILGRFPQARRKVLMLDSRRFNNVEGIVDPDTGDLETVRATFERIAHQVEQLAHLMQ